MLSATAVTHGFGSVRVLEDIDFALAPGDLLGLAGPSGAGKSTLGRILAGHLSPLSGQVSIDDLPLTLRAGRPCPVQYAPQVSELSLDPRWTVDRILRNGGAPDPEALRILGIRPEWSDRFPAELSGGELARVSLARLVLPSTRYLICDEIIAPLDAISAMDMMTALRRLAERGVGILVIGHNFGLLKRSVDRVLLLQSRKLAASFD
jgi:ABC-type dipeptide/oligopeptide/nickel transport system ATPase subunit